MKSEINSQMIFSKCINSTFLESDLKAIRKVVEKHEDIEELLKTYFTAGVTPEFATNSKDADALKGGTILFLKSLI